VPSCERAVGDGKPDGGEGDGCQGTDPNNADRGSWRVFREYLLLSVADVCFSITLIASRPNGWASGKGQGPGSADETLEDCPFPLASGINPGDQIVRDALVLENTVEQ